MDIAIREFKEEDIPFKVKWINDDRNNKYLHYDLPLREDNTLQWFKSLEGRDDRVDLTITYAGAPAGLIGLLNIDLNSKDAEYYICLGGDKFKGKGIANVATDLLIKKAYFEMALNKLYLYTEVENVRAQKLFEKSGFIKESLLKNNLWLRGNYIDRYMYTLDVENYICNEGVVKFGFK